MRRSHAGEGAKDSQKLGYNRNEGQLEEDNWDNWGQSYNIHFTSRGLSGYMLGGIGNKFQARGAGLLSWYFGLTKYGDWCSGIVSTPMRARIHNK
jgi:hypothetical protein